MNLNKHIEIQMYFTDISKLHMQHSRIKLTIDKNNCVGQEFCGAAQNTVGHDECVKYYYSEPNTKGVSV